MKEKIKNILKIQKNKKYEKNIMKIQKSLNEIDELNEYYLNKMIKSFN